MNKQKTILLVEDNEDILNFNKDALLMEGYEVLTALTLDEARERMAVAPPDAIILDIMLPDGSGLDFCAELRKRTQAPILFLTGLDEKAPLLQGLRAGGDDYLTKPYDIDELLARLAAQLRGAKPPTRLTRGPLTLDLLALRVFLEGEDLLLTQREFALLSLLVQHEGEILSKEFLYQTAWGLPMAGDAGALQTQISLLKKKLEEKSGGAITLCSFRGEGYSLDIA